MGEAIATNDQAMREFQEKLIEKLRTDIAGMLPDAVLAQMVQKAIEEQFFKPRKMSSGSGYSATVIDAPSWFVEEAAKEAKPLIALLVKESVDERKEEITKAIKEYLEPQNLTIIVYAAIRAEMGYALQQLTQQMGEKLRQGY